MATSTIVLYKGTEITRDKNRIIDSIDTFLATCNPVTITGAQYIKNGLHITLKLNLQQYYLDTRNDTTNIDYIKITNSDTSTPYYYFVDEKKWKSENTIEFTLTMDTLNSYKSKYVLSSKTVVHRQHMNRWQRINGVYRRLIDKKSEEINHYLFKQNSEKVLYIPGDKNRNLKYYLTYRADADITSSDTNTGLNCLIYVSESNADEYDIGIGSYEVTFTYNELLSMVNNDTTKILAILPNCEFQAYTEMYIPHWYTFRPGTTSNLVRVGLEIRFISGGFETYVIWGSGRRTKFDGELNNQPNPLSSFSLKLTQNQPQYIRRWDGTSFGPDVSPGPTPSDWLNNSTQVGYKFPTTDASSSFALNEARNIDLSDPKLVKVIELPYPPIQFTYVYGDKKFHIDTSYFNKWLSTDGSGSMRNLSISNKWAAKNEIGYAWSANHGENPLERLDDTIDSLIISASLLRNDDLESKIYHSDFYLPKYVYDSFSYAFMLERVNVESYIDAGDFTIKFYPSTSIQSKFLFEFPNYKVNDSGYEDYNGILCVQRNNEIALYNNAYLNYIRNGYNFDMKTKQRQAETSKLGVGLAALGVIASIAATVASEGALAPVMVASFAGLTSTVTNAINSSAQADQNMAQKLSQLKEQGTSVNGVEDIDLLNEYCGNKMKFVTYQLSERTRKAMLDLFYYCGYKYEAQAAPSTNTRYWFNFVQADIVFEETLCVTSEIAEDIKVRYAEGVTIMHYHQGKGDLKNGSRIGYNFKQNLENWETFILND